MWHGPLRRSSLVVCARVAPVGFLNLAVRDFQNSVVLKAEELDMANSCLWRTLGLWSSATWVGLRSCPHARFDS